MRTVSFYDQSGRIISTVSGNAESIEMTIESTDYPWIEGDWFGKPVYVVSGLVTDRPENPATLSGLTLLNVPVPSTIQIRNQYYEATESTVELEFNLPGTYTVKVIAWPYLDKEFTIENPAP